MENWKSSESSKSSVHKVSLSPDKYGKWNCRCFLIRTDSFWRRCVTTADNLMTRDPEVGPRFWFLADSIRQNESPRMCCNILINGNFEQGGYSGSDREAGDGGGRDLHRQRLPHQGWQPQGVPPSLDHKPKCQNVCNQRWGWGRSRQTWRDGLRWELGQFSKVKISLSRWKPPCTCSTTTSSWSTPTPRFAFTEHSLTVIFILRRLRETRRLKLL